MKRVLCLMMSLLLLWSCAAAEWTCPDPACGRTWDDQELFCNVCGWEAPLHGLHVTMAGDNSLRLEWYGYMADEVDLFYRTEGAGGWTLCGTTSKLKLNVAGLTKGTAYEFQLVDWNNDRLTIIGSTTANGVPLSDITALYDEAVARVGELEADVAARDATIAERDTTIAAQQTTIDEQAATIAERDTTIAAQQTTIAERDTTIAAQQTTIAERDTTIAAQQTTIDEQAATIAEQAAALAATPTPSPTPVPSPTPKPVKVGDYITFGHYPQTAAGTDNTPIEWLVLDVQGNKALVISRYGLDCKPYNTTSANVTWQTCSLRKWLNGEFLNKAFTGAEQAAIVLTTVDNSKSQCYSGWSTSGGNNTQDKVFLLSYAEANKYLGVTWQNSSNMKSRTSPTAYAKAQGAFQSSDNKTADGTGCCWWWLRSPGYSSGFASRVSSSGSLSSRYVYNSLDVVRPAFFLNLDSATLY